MLSAWSQQKCDTPLFQQKFPKIQEPHFFKTTKNFSHDAFKQHYFNPFFYFKKNMFFVSYRKFKKLRFQSFYMDVIFVEEI